MNVLRQIKPFGQLADSDRVFISELALNGPFAFVDQPLLKRQMRTHGYPSRQDRTIWFVPDRPNMVVFPYCRQLIEYVKVIQRAPLSRSERWACWRLMMKWIIKHVRLLLSDFSIALREILRALYYIVTRRNNK